MSDSVPNQRAEYRAPELVLYGKVRDLTETGSAGDSESATPMSNMCTPDFQPNPNTMC